MKAIRYVQLQGVQKLLLRKLKTQKDQLVLYGIYKHVEHSACSYHVLR